MPNTPFQYDTTKPLIYNLDAFHEWSKLGSWTPANYGSERPFLTRSGKRLLYVYQARSGRHAYIDLDSERILSQEEQVIHLEGHPMMAKIADACWAEERREEERTNPGFGYSQTAT